LALAHRIAAPFVVVIGQEMPVRVADMVPVIEGWLRVAEQENMPIQFETHRNCITNDLFTTVQLLEAVPEMRLAADLSHYVVDREMPCPPTPALQALISQVLSVPIRSKGAWLPGVRFSWRWISRRTRNGWPCFAPGGARGSRPGRLRHAGDGAVLVFLSELGPPDYALTNAKGEEMSDRWAEAQLLGPVGPRDLGRSPIGRGRRGAAAKAVAQTR
jgi:hypothetical protein